MAQWPSPLERISKRGKIFWQIAHSPCFGLSSKRKMFGSLRKSRGEEILLDIFHCHSSL